MTRHVGILGGTFDPPHVGHLIVADQVGDQLGLDEVRLVVNNRPWQKIGSRIISDPLVRLAMVEAAVEGSENLVASAVEIELGGPSYTFVTLDALRSQEPEVEFSVIVGSDAAAGLDTWHRADDLRSTAEFVVVNRGGMSSEMPPGWKLGAVEIPPVEVSSSELRAMVSIGRSIRHFTPDGVIHHIESLGLYSGGS